jgi:hypothetical protein
MATANVGIQPYLAGYDGATAVLHIPASTHRMEMTLKRIQWLAIRLSATTVMSVGSGSRTNLEVANA